MEKKVVIVCLIVGFLGLSAAALGFAAEAKRIKGSQIHMAPPSKCVYPKSPVLALGFAAAVALMIAQTIINVTTGCLCCTSAPYHFNRRQIGAILCSTLSWFTFVMAVLLLVIGAAFSSEKIGELAYFDSHYCSVVGHGIFAVGGIFSLTTVVLGLLSYVMLESVKNTDDDPWARPGSPGQPGIAMEQSQIV